MAEFTEHSLQAPISRARVLEIIADSDIDEYLKGEIEDSIESWHRHRKEVEAERDEFRTKLSKHEPIMQAAVRMAMSRGKAHYAAESELTFLVRAYAEELADV